MFRARHISPYFNIRFLLLCFGMFLILFFQEKHCLSVFELDRLSSLFSYLLLLWVFCDVSGGWVRLGGGNCNFVPILC